MKRSISFFTPLKSKLTEDRRVDARFWNIVFLLLISFVFGQARAQVPPPPTGLIATPSNGQVNLLWTPNPIATSSNVYRMLQDTPTPTPTGTLSPTPTPQPIATVLASNPPAFQDLQ